jgi:exonuclease III
VGEKYLIERIVSVFLNLFILRPLSLFVVLCLLETATAAEGEKGPPPGIVIDGLFEDWNSIEIAYQDAHNEGGVGEIDFGFLKATSDSARLYLYFKVGAELNLQSDHDIVLYLDTDDDPGTGRPVEGLGAEIQWSFGRRKGIAHLDGDTVGLDPASLGLRQSPTVSSDRFEISFKRSAMVRWTPLFPGDTMAVILRDEHDGIRDQLPEASERLEVSFDDHNPPPGRIIPIRRGHPSHLRVMTYNVLFDGLFERPGPFVSILRALDPDIICFQEIWKHTAKQTADMVSLALPDAVWYAETSGRGVLISRYPIIDSHIIVKESGNLWALIDLPDDRYIVDLSVINAHPPCCDNNAGRELELDAIAAWTRELMTSGGERLPRETPMIIAGDMNLVGPASQLDIILAGRIVNQERFGEPFAPDWDGTPLTDVRPYHTTGRESYTWRSLSHYDGSFAPGRLDYILYTDSVLELANHFVLCTEEMSPQALQAAGLMAYETAVASDHLPVVADFVVPSSQAAGNADR